MKMTFKFEHLKKQEKEIKTVVKKSMDKWKKDLGELYEELAPTYVDRIDKAVFESSYFKISKYNIISVNVNKEYVDVNVKLKLMNGMWRKAKVRFLREEKPYTLSRNAELKMFPPILKKKKV